LMSVLPLGTFDVVSHECHVLNFRQRVTHRVAFEIFEFNEACQEQRYNPHKDMGTHSCLQPVSERMHLHEVLSIITQACHLLYIFIRVDHFAELKILSCGEQRTDAVTLVCNVKDGLIEPKGDRMLRLVISFDVKQRALCRRIPLKEFGNPACTFLRRL
jgi:hypothetical protein